MPSQKMLRTLLRTFSTMIMIILVTPSGVLSASSDTTLVKAVSAKNIEEIEIAVAKLAMNGTAIDMEAVINEALLSDQPEVEKAALRGLKRLSPGVGLSWLCTQAKEHSRKQVRDLLMTYLATRKESESFKAVLQGLYDPEDSVVLSAISALLKKDHNGCIPHIIRALRFQEDKDKDLSLVAEKLRETMRELTGADLFAASEWDSLWKGNRKKLEKKEKLDPSKIVMKGSGVKVTPIRFFGHELVSQKIVFILDTSISMKAKDPKVELEGVGEKNNPGKGTGVNHKRDQDDKNSDDLPDSRMRLRRVQKELKRMIRELPKSFQFCLISFDADVEQMSQQLIKAHPNQKRRAMKFIDGFDPEGFTSTDLALDAAFSINGVRTIVLLSDGMPYRAANPIDGSALLDNIDARNRFEHIPIHTIGFRATSGSASTFLAELSRRSGGKYTEIP
ncbi:MAG: hypothetical protein GWP39_08255 [Planctomycetia bacterium]|nr:hypothetical protein [Planctomycetia bacterium]